ncbi:MAG: nuclear transport factor 2 family protein [Terracidiphilus sp.]
MHNEIDEVFQMGRNNHSARQQHRLAKLLFAAFLCLICNVPAFAQSVSAGEDQIRQLQQKYRESVNTLAPRLINEIWSHDTPVTFIHPLGTDDGLDAIQSDIYGKTMGLFSSRELLFDTAVIHIYGNTAWSEINWTFHAVWKDSGKPVTTQGRETQIYLRENGVWHLVHVHYSGPPTQVVKKGV